MGIRTTDNENFQRKRAKTLTMTKTKKITLATLGGITLFALGMTSGIWLATPDIISGAPQDAPGHVPRWAWELCECSHDGITYLMPDVWSRGE